jgi:hypothetical protein
LVFEKINKIDKPLAILTKRRREKTQINRVREEKENFIRNTNQIQRIIREYFGNLHFNRLENLEEMDKFLDAHSLSKLKDINHLNRSVTSSEIEAIILSQQRKAQD